MLPPTLAAPRLPHALGEAKTIPRWITKDRRFARRSEPCREQTYQRGRLSWFASRRPGRGCSDRSTRGAEARPPVPRTPRLFHKATQTSTASSPYAGGMIVRERALPKTCWEGFDDGYPRGTSCRSKPITRQHRRELRRCVGAAVRSANPLPWWLNCRHLFQKGRR